MPTTSLQPGDLLALPGGTSSENVAALLSALRPRLTAEVGAARLPALVPYDPSTTAESTLTEITERARRRLPEGTSAVLRSSGSTTGRGHLVAVTATALRAGARSGERALGGTGRWVLALPAHHIAGFQILVRSVVGGTDPVLVDTSAGFDPHQLAEAVTHARAGGRCYVSLVPTQLHRVLQAGPAVLAAVARASAILVGGAATPPPLQQAARAAGLPIVTSYGMTETCGGCAYDGVALEGVRLRLMTDEATPAAEHHREQTGRVAIAGPVLAAGYLEAPEEAEGAAARSSDPSGSGFVVDAAGTRWMQTSDLGVITEGRLRIVGRVDDVINTGGVKVSPGPVEDVLAAVAGVGDVVVVGLPDERWGQRVVALVVPAVPQAPPALETLRAAVLRELGPPHAPRALVSAGAIPLLGPGKPDRRAAARLAEQRITEEAATDGHGH